MKLLSFIDHSAINGLETGSSFKLDEILHQEYLVFAFGRKSREIYR